MLRLLRGSLFLLALAALAPQPAEAQLFRHLFHDCCLTCTQPLCSCTCVEPVVETCLRPQKCVNYKQVTMTGTRKQAYTQTVPVQKHHNVCVDEGNWKMVWCPKPVVKTVTKTEYRQRVCYQNVPYNYNVTVPEVTTTYVPQPRVRMARKECSPFYPVCPPNPCPPTFVAPTPAAYAPADPSCVAPVAPQAVMADPSYGEAAAYPTPLSTRMAHQPAPAHGYAAPPANGQWMTVPARTPVAGQAPPAYGAPQYHTQPVLQPAAGQQPPSAATVWQTRPAVPAF